jgi:hypothetical protein
VVNGLALRGLSTINSAESMGAGRITFGFFSSWYQQQEQYNNTPNVDANIFTSVGSFSYGVNSKVDLFASVAGFGMSNYTKGGSNSGLGTIQAGVQGTLPFPKHAFISMGGQTAIIGGTSKSQINTNRSDGYNYFETRNKYSFLGKLMQTVNTGNEDYGFKVHLNESGVICIDQHEPVLLLMGAGLQANAGIVVLGAELNSRTRFNDLSFGTDPLWFTPSIHIRTPYQMNAMVGADVSLSADRSNNNPRALEPYRIFGSIAFSFDMLASKRKAALDELQKCVDNLRSHNRPILCTEYMARPNGSTFEPHLGYLKAAGVAAYNWGFVAGKTQTIYPWDSWKKTYTSEPPVWFHDIFRADGSAYIPKEVEYIRGVTGKK